MIREASLHRLCNGISITCAVCLILLNDLSSCHAQADLLHSATEEESKIRTGRIFLKEEINTMPLSTKRISEKYIDIEQRKGAKQLQAEALRPVIVKKSLTFSSGKGQMLIESDDDRQIEKSLVLITTDSVYAYIKQCAEKIPSGLTRNVPTQIISRKPATLNVPLSLWSSRFWSNLKTRVKKLDRTYRTNSGNNITIFQLQSNTKAYVEYTPATFSVKSIKHYDGTSGRLRYEVRIQSKSVQNADYPSEVTETLYDNDSSGKSEATQITVSRLDKADLNTEISEETFSPVKIPTGTMVTDNRVNPPLTYQQGNKQFSYGDTDYFSHTPAAFTAFGLEGGRNRPTSSPRSLSPKEQQADNSTLSACYQKPFCYGLEGILSVPILSEGILPILSEPILSILPLIMPIL